MELKWPYLFILGRIKFIMTLSKQNMLFFGAIGQKTIILGLLITLKTSFYQKIKVKALELNWSNKNYRKILYLLGDVYFNDKGNILIKDYFLSQYLDNLS
jgi:hypothetical protein